MDSGTGHRHGASPCCSVPGTRRPCLEPEPAFPVPPCSLLFGRSCNNFSDTKLKKWILAVLALLLASATDSSEGLEQHGRLLHQHHHLYRHHHHYKNASSLSTSFGLTAGTSTNANFLSQVPLQAKTRPCSASANAVVINVFVEGDFARRALYAPSQTVKFVLQKSLTLSKGLLFGPTFSCTWLLSAAGGYTLQYPGSDMPVLRVLNSSNILILGVNFFAGVSASSPPCANIPEIGYGSIICPAVHIYQSFGIQLAKGSVHGRVDLFRSAYCRIDSLYVTAPGNYERSFGVIRVAISGIGPKLIRSMNIISNNEVFGHDTPIVLYLGAIGVTVVNNYIHDYIFAGIRCGADVSYIGDCMLSTISNNFVFAPIGERLTGDSAGIYYCIHWVNPGNVAKCNYVVGGDHCYYLDYVSSGIKIDGGACIDTTDGVKLNNGKWNSIKSLIAVRLKGSTLYTQCLTPTINNCRKYPGSFWEYIRTLYYDSTPINALYPYLQNICKERSINGYSCNPPIKRVLTGRQTGYCSGLPTNNDIEITLVDGAGAPPGYKYCERMPTVPKFNTLSYINISSVRAGFRSFRNNNLGLTRASPLARRPGFTSCPRSLVGPMRVSSAVYVNAWNIPKPAFMDELATMDLDFIHQRPNRGPKRPPGNKK